MADALREQGRAFLDAAGNAYIRQPDVLVWVNGRKRAIKAEAPQLGRAFQPTGLQVLFALLCHPQWVSLPYRELATRAAGVAHGTVGWVMPDLQQQGFVADLNGKRGTRRLYDGERLLALWADGRRPRAAYHRFEATYYAQILSHHAQRALSIDVTAPGAAHPDRTTELF